MIRYQEWNSCKQNTQEVKKVKYSVLAGKTYFMRFYRFIQS